ncbi:MAG TPA: RNA methyltransferase [Vicinamibacterales bacterium]|nr:RNA methyltransferase [Vicinamibacterales bacterium]
MTVQRIDCADDARAAAYRDLADGELLRTRGMFVAEGRLVVRRLLDERRDTVESLLVNEAALRDLAPSIDTLDPAVPVLVCATADFQRLTGFNIHRGCLALVRRPPPTPVDALIASAQLLVVLEGVTNADNVGGVFRNAAAFDAGGVLLSPTSCDPLYRKAIRTSMGAALRVPFARAADGDWPGAVERLRTAGFAVVALTPRQPSEALDAFAARPQPARVALVLGTEGAGLTPAVEAAADYRVRIPISSSVDSLNIAVATGIALSRLAAIKE